MTALPGSVAVVPTRRISRGLWHDAARRLLRNGPAIVGIVFIAFFVIAAILAPIIAPYSPTA
ncbi:MAG: hypothetical protein ACXWM8_05710, partial [Candidatus Limnocylindrales bacterium]